jgi:hypothetical protein
MGVYGEIESMQTIELLLGGIIVISTLVDVFQQAETPRISFEAAYTRLKSAGFCLADPEPALASFIVLRSAYADALHSLMEYWVVSQRKF